MAFATLTSLPGIKNKEQKIKNKEVDRVNKTNDIIFNPCLICSIRVIGVPPKICRRHLPFCVNLRQFNLRASAGNQLLKTERRLNGYNGLALINFLLKLPIRFHLHYPSNPCPINAEGIFHLR